MSAGATLPLRLTADRFDETVSAFCDAFHDYPVMRYVIGDSDADYARKLRPLIAYFTESRFSRNYPVLGIEADGGLVAAANIDPPHRVPAPPQLQRTYAALGELLGAAAIERYRSFANACAALEPAGRHFHLGMIGVVRNARGRGYARRLLDAVHAMSARDPESNGVSLTTETPRNLPFYEHFGYRVLGRATTQDGGLETFTLFRPDGA